MTPETAMRIVVLAMLALIVGMVVWFAGFDFLPTWIGYNGSIKHYIDSCNDPRFINPAMMGGIHHG